MVPGVAGGGVGAEGIAKATGLSADSPAPLEAVTTKAYCTPAVREETKVGEVAFEILVEDLLAVEPWAQ